MSPGDNTLHIGHQLKILWGKSQATVPHPWEKVGRRYVPIARALRRYAYSAKKFVQCEHV